MDFTKLLGPSWRTQVGGILTILAGLCTLIVTSINAGHLDMVAMGVFVTTLTAGMGLMAAKDAAVTNSPTPLKVAQEVEKKP